MKGLLNICKKTTAIILSVFCVLCCSFSFQALAEEAGVTEKESQITVESVELRLEKNESEDTSTIILKVRLDAEKDSIKTVLGRIGWTNNNPDRLYSNFYVLLEYSETEDLFIGYYNTGVVADGILYAEGLNIIDQEENTSTISLLKDGDYQYYINVESGKSNSVSDFSFKGGNHEYTLDEAKNNPEILGISVTTESSFGDYSYVFLSFETENGQLFYIYLAEGKSENVYDTVHDSNVYSFNEPGKYELTLKTASVVLGGVGEIKLNIPDIDQNKFILNVGYEDLGLTGPLSVSNVNISANGEFVSPGDEVKISLSFDNIADPADSAVSVVINPSVMDTGQSVEISLSYDSQTGMYTGTWMIDENTYPCEWYLSVALVTLQSSFYMNVPLNSVQYYVNVKNGTEFENPSMDLTVRIMEISENGWILEDDYQIENVSRRYTLSDLGISLPEMKSFRGVEQTGWGTDQPYQYDEITEETVLLNEWGYITIYPKYEKIFAPVYISYVDQNGSFIRKAEIFEFDEGETKDDLKNAVDEYELPTAMTSDYSFTGWEISSLDYMPDNLPNPFIGSVSISAKYENAVMTEVGKLYVVIDDMGYNMHYETSAFMLKEGSTVREAKEQLIQSDHSEKPEKMNFKGWKFDLGGRQDDALIQNGDHIEMTATYGMYYVNLTIYDTNNGEILYSQENFMKEGDVIEIPETIDGVEGLHWQNGELGPGTSIVVGKDISDYIIYLTGFGTKKKATRPDNETITDAITEIENSADGETVIIPMNGAAILPKEILMAIAYRNVDVVLEMNGYKWRVKGNSLYSVRLSDINMEVTMDTHVIPDEAVQSVAENNTTRQFALSHSGEFGFKAFLTLNIGMENAGKFCNLYSYNADQKLDIVGSYEIREDGTVELKTAGTPDYLIVISDKPVTAEPEPEPSVVFGDVAESSPYYDAIYWAAGSGITTGKTATTFAPDAGCTRAQFVTFLWRMQGKPEPAKTAGFADMVSSTSPFYKAISWAVEQGITSGYADNTFRPNDTCSRGAAVTFLYRAAKEPELETVNVSFSDMVAENHAYYKGIVWAVTNKVTDGYKDGTFKPFRTCSRGQNVTFLYRARNII